MSEKPKVLVVDDDQRMVKTICDILRVKGLRRSWGSHDPHQADRLLADTCDSLAIEKKGERAHLGEPF